MSGSDPRIWDDAPSILIFADRPRDCATGAAIATGIGARVIGTGTLASALPRLARQVAVDAVLLELDGWSGAVEALLDWAEEAAETGFAIPVMSFPRALVDVVMARITAPAVVMLCDASPEERAAALAFALASRRYQLHDHGLEADAERLRRLSQEVARIATALSEISQAAQNGAAPTTGRAVAPSPAALRPQAIRALIRVRRLRGNYFPSHLFADPAWDMLLDLTAARLEGERVAVSSLCIAANVPPTTALRWIRTMTEQGLFVRRHDPEDGRRIFIELAEPAAAAMTSYFGELQTGGWRPS